jgi:hypothetical protein
MSRDVREEWEREWAAALEAVGEVVDAMDQDELDTLIERAQQEEGIMETEETTFTEEQQQEINRIVQDRLEREREKLQEQHAQELAEKDAQLAAAQQEQAGQHSALFGRAAEREARSELAARGLMDRRRQDLILQNADLESKVGRDQDGMPDSRSVRSALRDVLSAAPELFGNGFSWDGRVDGGATGRSAPYTRDQLANMSEAEINANWDKVQQSLAQQR